MTQPITITLGVDDKNYSEAQSDRLVQAFTDHGFAVETERLVYKSAILLPGVILLVLGGFPLKKLADMFAEQMYNAWLRPVLADTLFKPRNTEEPPRLEIESSNVHIFLVAGNEVECDVAVGQMKDLATAVEGSDLIINATPRTLRLDYREGTWTVHVDRMSKSYDYEPGSRKLLEQGKP